MSDIRAIIFKSLAHLSDIFLMVVTIEELNTALSHDSLKITNKIKVSKTSNDKTG